MSPVGPTEPYSTLEIDFRNSDTHKQAAIAYKDDTQKEHVPISGNQQTTTTTTDPGLEPDIAQGKEKTICGLRRRYFWLAVAAVGICVVVGAVVGGVVGSRAPGATPSEDTSSTADTTSELTSSSKLAAVYYRDDSLVAQHRLYYQTGDKIVHEYARNSTDLSWYHLSELGTAVANTSIAATVTYKPWAFDLRVYYLTQGNFIQELITREDTGASPSRWDGQEEVSLSAQNVQVHEAGSIAALWFRQTDPVVQHIYALYQDTNGNLTLLSGGADGWISEPVTFHPAADTPVAMVQSWPVRNNYTFLTMFYREEETGDIPGLWGTEEMGWDGLSVPCPARSGDPDTSIASFVFESGKIKIMVLLVSNADGVTSYSIVAGQPSWQSDKPAAMAGLDRNTPLAATEDGRAFGFEKGVIKEFRFGSDGSWSATGDVVAL